MSARRLRQPAPISASGYKALGTSIITTLAILPRWRGADLHDSDPPSQNEPLTGPPSSLRNAVPNVLNNFLHVENILADFDGSHIPVFIRPTHIEHPNVSAIQEVLNAYDEGVPIKPLIKANFPKKDFQYHLISYIRNRARICTCPKKTLESRLLNAYIIGVKEWCAAALDAFILQVEVNLVMDDESSHIDSSEGAEGHQGREPAPWTRQFFLEQAALHQRKALETLGERTYENTFIFKDSSKWEREWSQYKEEHRTSRRIKPITSMSAGKSDLSLMLQELRFISGLMRNLYPRPFASMASEIAHRLKSIGAPCHLVNLLKNMRWYPEDVADDTGLQGASTPSLAERVDLPRMSLHTTYPLSVLDDFYIRRAFRSWNRLPPFLQSGYKVKDFKTEAINKIIEHCGSGEDDKALSVMDHEFNEAEEFHEHFLALIRTAMRSYVLPKPSNDSGDLEVCNLCGVGTPLGDFLQRYVKELQRWCADVHEFSIEKLDNAINAAYQSKTEEESRDLIKWIREVQPTYTQNLKSLMDQMNFAGMGEIPAPPDTPLWLPLPVEELRESMYIFKWLMKEMPWDRFLFFRPNLASLVRELNGGKQGFSFLVNILESLSFTADDIDEFKQFTAEAKRLNDLRWLNPDRDDFVLGLMKRGSIPATRPARS
eukprot:Blabericola_migrator_1__1613@NODE_1430_length_4555_cov_33_005125_g540_i1_p1_GENE_NODE_1430_length_4555_cov_33_005125_g540_i1NODE_1430_length_4555_cov_33_005125_g540_i1_p1_ORF_typecomplete_len658_score76_56_NODE_1430_length_4555_cov_33_005125_g540_i15972570